MTLSEHVKNLRKQEGLTQQELADRAGVGIHFVRPGAGEEDSADGQSE